MDQYVGEIRMFAGNWAPDGPDCGDWRLCNGDTIPISGNEELFALLGTRYGGDGRSTFGLPNLQSRIPLHVGQGVNLDPVTLGQTGGAETITITDDNIPPHTHSVLGVNGYGTNSNPSDLLMANSVGNRACYYPGSPTPVPGLESMSSHAVSTAGSRTPVEIVQPYLVINYIIALNGAWPDQQSLDPGSYFGELRMFSYPQLPMGWTACDGAQLNSNSNSAAYALWQIIGNAYGGVAPNFNLPDLRGRAAVGAIWSADGYKLGQTGGSNSSTLTAANLPMHIHTLYGTTDAANSGSPAGCVLAVPQGADNEYAPVPVLIESLVEMGAPILASTGVSAEMSNMQPYIGIVVAICTSGPNLPTRQ